MPFQYKPKRDLPRLGKLGAMTAVEEVNDEADDEPDEEAVPGDDG